MSIKAAGIHFLIPYIISRAKGKMDKNASSDSLGWGASFFMQATEDATRAFFAATSAATVQSPRPSVVYSLRDDTSNSNLQKLRNQVTKMIKGFSPPPEVKGTYNPEVLTRQKRQWAKFHLKSTVILISFSEFGIFLDIFALLYFLMLI